MKERVKIDKDNILFRERQYFGFFLRFACASWRPCDRCQERLEKLWFKESVTFSEGKIVLSNCGKEWCFDFRDRGSFFVPCKDCQTKLSSIIFDGQWTIGNKDYQPLVELNLHWDLADYKHPLLGVHLADSKSLVGHRLQCKGCDQAFLAKAEIWWTDYIKTLIGDQRFYLCPTCGAKQAAEVTRDQASLQ